MPNLFPTDSNFEDVNVLNNEDVKFKGSYKFDFVKGEFVKNPDGTIAKCNEKEAYMQWCQKIMLTRRYLLAYSSKYGNDIKDLVGSGLSRPAIELEIKRMTKEALLVHPKTIDVENFKFIWDNVNLYFEYEVRNQYKESFTLSNELKVR